MKTLGVQVIFLQIFTGHLCSAQKVKTPANHEAILGGNVTIKCALLGSYDVLQVTWQKLNGHSEENMATFSKTYGSNIVGSFRGRATFIPSEVTESIINLSGVRFEDEGCYQCLFNTFPDGAKIGKTCLSVHVIPEPTLQFSQIDAATNRNGYDGFVATCSATGRPAPVITWNTTDNVMVLSIQSSKIVLDGRVKITSNLTMAKAGAADCKVICVVNHPALERAITLEDFLKTTSSDQWRMKLPILIAFATSIMVVCLVICNRRNTLNYFKSLIWNKGPGIPPIFKTTTTIPEDGNVEHFNNLKDPAEESFISHFSQNIKKVFSPSKVQNDSPDRVTLTGKSPICHGNVTCLSRNSSPYKTLSEFTHHISVTISSPSTPSLYLRKSPYIKQSEASYDKKEKSCKRSLQEKFVASID